MKTVLLLLTLGFRLEACEPPPHISFFCKNTPVIKLDLDITNELYKSLSIYEEKRNLFVFTDNPKTKKRYGDGSCFLFNWAVGYVKDLIASSKPIGTTCKGSLLEIKNSAQALLSKEADENKHIQTKEKKRKLSRLRSKANKKLTKFCKSHNIEI